MTRAGYCAKYCPLQHPNIKLICNSNIGPTMGITHHSPYSRSWQTHMFLFLLWCTLWCICSFLQAPPQVVRMLQFMSLAKTNQVCLLLFNLFLCLFLPLWPFQLYFIPYILLKTPLPHSVLPVLFLPWV